MKVVLEQDILQENDRQAEENRALFGNCLVINMIGSPGCGKTTILERTIERLAGEISMAVIEGDIYTTRDAERIEKKGVPVIQINTAGGCHLSAEAIAQAVSGLELERLDLLIIENVGNLVCPAEFNLGEDHKIAVLSTVEGDDKPVKYPLLFQEAGLVIINKTDLLPYTSFDMLQAESDIRSLNRRAPILKVSALDHGSLEPWYRWIRAQMI